MTSGVVTVEREMGCTRDECLAWLRGMGGLVPSEGPREVSVHLDEGSVVVDLTEREARRIGAVSIPVLHVVFRFVGVERPAREAFLAAFDARTHRGGG